MQCFGCFPMLPSARSQHENQKPLASTTTPGAASHESLHEQPNVRASVIQAERQENALEIVVDMDPKNESEREPLTAELTELAEEIERETPGMEEGDDPQDFVHPDILAAKSASTVSRGRSESSMRARSSCESMKTTDTDAADDASAITDETPSSDWTASGVGLPTLLTSHCSLPEVFKAFCGPRSEMDSKGFFKMCKDCELIDKNLSNGDVDLIFTKVSPDRRRRISLEQFLEALEEIARRKKVNVNSVCVAVQRSAGPVKKSTKANACRFHDDKSTYTGTHANGGPETGRKGKGCVSRRGASESFDSTSSSVILEPRGLDATARPSAVKKVSAVAGHMRRHSGSSSDEGGSVEDTFRAYCRNGEQMDGKSFAKMCKDCQLVGENLSETDVDLIFAKFKARNQRHMDISMFKNALQSLACRKGVKVDDVIEAIAGSSGPVLMGTLASRVRFHDAARLVKTTVDLDDEQAWRLTLRPEQRHEPLPRFVAERFGDSPETPQQFNSRTMANFQRERRVLRDAVKRRAPLDTDELTMVFTDVQGSTSLWEANPKAMEQALRLHDAAMRLNMAKHDGYEVTTEGDAFQIAFHDAFDAVGFCLDLQAYLRSCDWPEATLQHPDACVSNDGAWRGLRVRMGMHSGKPLPPTKHEVTGRWRYAGRSVAIAKAIEEASHGGQILVSEDSFSQINGLLTQLQSPQVIDLGEHILQVHGQQKDEQVRLLQLVPAAFAHDHFSCDACSARTCSCCSGCIGGRVFPPVITKAEVSPGFHASPAGEAITLCFVFTKGARDLVASDPALAAHALGMLRQCVRSSLTAFGRGGYECQEDEGAFMLAFPSLSETAAFATNLQSELARLPWQDELRSCSPAFEQGLKVSIGALHGSYTSRGPHACTGRADYFGTMVNRTARIAQSAHPGQVLFGADPLCAVAGSASDELSMELPDGAMLERLGAFAFKGIAGPLVIHELRSPSDDGQFETFPEPKTKGRVGD